MRRSWLLLSVAAAAQLAAASAQAQLVQSTFAAEVEGWLNVTLPYPSAVPPTELASYAPTWEPGLGGYIRLTDPDGSGQTGNCQYWTAPAAYLGDQSLAYGGALAFDLACSGGGFGSFHQEDVILVGNGVTLVYDMATVPEGSFTPYSVPFSETGWKIGSLVGLQPTPEEFRSVLASVTKLYIRAEYQLGPDTQFLDNVTLSGGAVGVESGARPPRLTVQLPSPNPSRGAVNVQFVSPVSGGGTVEIFDASGRQVAALARGHFSAGPHVLRWDGRDANGIMAAAGLYWVRVRVGSEIASRAIVRIR